LSCFKGGELSGFAVLESRKTQVVPEALSDQNRLTGGFGTVSARSAPTWRRYSHDAKSEGKIFHASMRQTFNHQERFA